MIETGNREPRLSSDRSNGGKRAKFSDPYWTAKGESRAVVSPTELKVLWFNTGTLCNLTCDGCYIESSPRNDRLAYLTRSEVLVFLAEAKQHHDTVKEVGFTGGEPFMNPDILEMIGDALALGYRVLILTNALVPMQHRRQGLLNLKAGYPDKMSLRVSLDHFTQEVHERIRGPRSWTSALAGLRWLSENEFDIAVAARNLNDDERTLRHGFDGLFAEQKIAIDASDPHRLVIFPEMDSAADVPEISEKCWTILGKRPVDVMCATSRMIVKRKYEERPTVVSCTLLPYEKEFELGRTLSEALRPVRLNHPRCAKFCVLGGASCSA